MPWILCCEAQTVIVYHRHCNHLKITVFDGHRSPGGQVEFPILARGASFISMKKSRLKFTFIYYTDPPDHLQTKQRSIVYTWITEQ